MTPFMKKVNYLLQQSYDRAMSKHRFLKISGLN